MRYLFMYMLSLDLHANTFKGKTWTHLNSWIKAFLHFNCKDDWNRHIIILAIKLPLYFVCIMLVTTLLGYISPLKHKAVFWFFYLLRSFNSNVKRCTYSSNIFLSIHDLLLTVRWHVPSQTLHYVHAFISALFDFPSNSRQWRKICVSDKYNNWGDAWWVKYFKKEIEAGNCFKQEIHKTFNLCMVKHIKVPHHHQICDSNSCCTPSKILNQLSRLS